MARLVFLGRLEDVAGGAELAVAGGGLLAALIDGLPGDLAAALKSPKIRVAVNGRLIAADGLDGLTVGDADEIAFLPPVSGG